MTENGTFTAEFNNTEIKTLERELASGDVIGWLRNIDRKPWALCVPYEIDGEDRPMYPDFVVVRSDSGNLVVDIVDPHTISLADAPAKAAGLAKFAAQHADKFGRIELIMVDGTTSKRLELTDEIVRNKVRGITLPSQLRQLFADTYSGIVPVPASTGTGGVSGSGKLKPHARPSVEHDAVYVF